MQNQITQNLSEFKTLLQTFIEPPSKEEVDGDSIMTVSDEQSLLQILEALPTDSSSINTTLSELTIYFADKIKNDFLQRRQEKVRMRAMQVFKGVIFPFILNVCQSAENETLDLALTLFNDIAIELFEKVRDIYCVLDSVKIISDQLIAKGVQIKQIRENIFTPNFTTKLLTSVSSPSLHVPQYNFATRGAVYKIYEQISMDKTVLLDKIDPSVYVSCVLSSIENEADPRNLIIVFDLILFMLLNFCQPPSSLQRKYQIDPVQLDTFIIDIFDKMSCYFPINFTPPKDDKFKITPEKLKAKLKAAFLASDHREMVDNALPFVLEKLATKTHSTKIECLELVTEMVQKFDHQGPLSEHLEVIVSSIQNDFFNVFNTELQNAARSSLCQILNSIELKREQLLNSNQASNIYQVSNSISNYTLAVLTKCRTEIQQEPEGMGAFLSSQLLSDISSKHSSHLTQKIMTYLTTGDQCFIQETLNLIADKKFADSLFTAYLQVLTNIISEANTQQQTTKNSKKQIVEIIWSIITKSDNFEQICKFGLEEHNQRDVIFEKTLKLYCQIIVLQIKVKGDDAGANFVNSENVAKFVMMLNEKYLAASVPEGMDAEQFEAIQIVILNNLALISGEAMSQYHILIADILRSNFQNYVSDVQIQILESGLLCDIKSVQWILKRIQDTPKTFDNSEIEILTKPIQKYQGKQADLDETFTKFLSNQNILNINYLLAKTIVQKSSDEFCTKLIETLIQNESALTYKELQILNFILKKKAIDFQENLVQKILQGSNDVRRQTKALFWITIKIKKGEGGNVINMLEESENTSISCLGICKALLMRGENIGFKRTIAEFKKNHEDLEFSQLFNKIIIKRPSSFVTKENGFQYLNKMYTQRLFSTMYPVVQEIGSSHQMMQLCSLVSLQTLENQNRLQELIPIAQEALSGSEADDDVKLTSLALFRKILVQAAQEDSQQAQKDKALEYLTDFIPVLLLQMTESVLIKIESINTLTEICQKYPPNELKRHTKQVKPVLIRLLDDRKRAVRKFTRRCINDWEMM